MTPRTPNRFMLVPGSIYTTRGAVIESSTNTAQTSKSNRSMSLVAGLSNGVLKEIMHKRLRKNRTRGRTGAISPKSPDRITDKSRDRTPKNERKRTDSRLKSDGKKLSAVMNEQMIAKRILMRTEHREPATRQRNSLAHQAMLSAISKRGLLHH